MFDLMISPATLNATSSPASESGLTLCAAPAGPIVGPCGPALAPANLSARQAKELGLMTSGTYGPRSSTLSSSATLASSLANRLRARTDLLGSTLFNLTWKVRTTPSGRSISALRASARRTSDKDSTGRPTPTTRDWKDGSECPNVPINALLGRTAWLASWPTPATDNFRSRGGERKDEMGVDQIVRTLQPARLTAFGEMLTGCSAGMESGGQLRPEHPRYLMGIPDVWDACVPTGTRSSPRKPKHSSPRISMPTNIFD